MLKSRAGGIGLRGPEARCIHMLRRLPIDLQVGHRPLRAVLGPTYLSHCIGPRRKLGLKAERYHARPDFIKHLNNNII